MRNSRVWGTLALAIAMVIAAVSTARAGGIESLRVLYCGHSIGKDKSRWTPGFDKGKPVEMANNCYLIRHRDGLFLWESGLIDAVAAKKDGVIVANGAIHAMRRTTLKADLGKIGVEPDDVRYLAVSHHHGDHSGNTALFAKSTLVLQRAEYEVGFKDHPKKLAQGQKVLLLDGDWDVFGDGSVIILSTPGHTPGHQSILVTLPRTGPIVITGDVVHLRENWDRRAAPTRNFNMAQSLASIDRLKALVKEKGARLWIHHDKDNSARLHAEGPLYE